MIDSRRMLDSHVRIIKWCLLLICVSSSLLSLSMLVLSKITTLKLTIHVQIECFSKVLFIMYSETYMILFINDYRKGKKIN